MTDANGLYQDQYRVASTRWAGYDYSQNGIYFITICTKNRKPYFGEIQPGTRVGDAAFLQPTASALRAVDCWQAMPQHFSFVEPDAFVVMPDHVHGILFFHKPDPAAPQRSTFGPQRQNLASVVRGFKIGVQGWATRQQAFFEWQSSYFDRVIRGETELAKARRYIADNPTAWLRDEAKPDGIFR